MVQRRTLSFIFSLCAGVITSFITALIFFSMILPSLSKFISEYGLAIVFFVYYPIIISFILGILMIICSIFIYKGNRVNLMKNLVVIFSFMIAFLSLHAIPNLFIGLLILIFGCVSGILAE